ncbi:MAG: DUF2062 domain-containing protein [Nitrospirae bacterium]|nr:DUF2062 domain-containing protein [Nitrospirota bacterium]
MALRDRLRGILRIKDTPHRLAIAFAVGVFIGMSPLLGLHTVLGIALAWIFRWNKIVTMTGVFVTNPWTIVPIYTFSTWVGAKCLGVTNIIPDIDWSNIRFVSILSELESLLIPFILGTTLVGLISAILGYFIIYSAVKKAHKYAK